MKIVPIREAVRDIREFEIEVRKFLWSRIEELEDKGLSHEKVKLIYLKGAPIYRLKIDPESKKDINHRVIFDIKGNKIVILAAFDRDKTEGYPEKEIEDRR